MIKIFVKALVFSVFLSTALKASAQDLQNVFLSSNNNGSGPVYSYFNIPEGKAAEIVGGYGNFYIFKQVDGQDNGESGFISLNANANFPHNISGPARIRSSDAGTYFLTLRLKDNIATTTTIPTSAVVIPTDATGPVNVILESSTDLVTWTQANHGTYGASTTKRFFRVRAVNQ